MIKMRLVGLMSHAKKYIVLHVLWQWFGLFAQMLAVLTIAEVLEKALWQEADATLAGQAVVLLVITAALRFLCEKMSAKSSYRASVDVKRILRTRIYEKLLRLGATYTEKISTSEIVQVSTEGVDQLEIYFGKYLPQLIYSLLAPITLFVVLSFTSLKASVVLLVCVPLIPLSIVVVQKIAKRLLNQYWGIYTGLGDSFLENLQGLTTLKIYQADGRKAESMDKEAQHFRRVTMKVLTMQLNSTSVMDIVAYGGAAIGIIVAILEFLNGRLDVSGTLTIILLASEFFIPLRLLGSFFHIAMNGMAASDKIFHLLDLPEEEPGKEFLSGTELPISLQEVRFSYEEDREILKGISLEVPAGAFVSLVGSSGCGKSTIASLIAGKNRSYRGVVNIGGIPVSAIPEEELMKQLTVVRHNSYLFKGTVADNLRMAKPDAGEDELKKVLVRVRLWDFLRNQNGLDTKVLEKGENLSGGQCQRLALARALLHDTPVYIFDEATSNIDAESEEQIMGVIHQLAKTKTVILISHRLSNVTSSDRIYMLEAGGVCETGTHEELMKKGGSYQKLYESQRRLENYGMDSQAEEEESYEE